MIQMHNNLAMSHTDRGSFSLDESTTSHPTYIHSCKVIAKTHNPAYLAAAFCNFFKSYSNMASLYSPASPPPPAHKSACTIASFTPPTIGFNLQISLFNTVA
mmetsp:Transcript_17006/g.35295  ORF Transcript_17006/g.35295 Transcript_17006/m.35295 type:complete len:102 (+) Transcript_17006:1984-2289(+)